MFIRHKDRKEGSKIEEDMKVLLLFERSESKTIDRAQRRRRRTEPLIDSLENENNMNERHVMSCHGLNETIFLLKL